MNLNPNEQGILLYSLENLIDLLASPTSADVAADPDKAALDRQTAMSLRDQIARQLSLDAQQRLNVKAQAAQPIRERSVAFVRHEGAEVTTVGVMRVRADADADVGKALVKAVTSWVNTSDRGHKVWQDSCCDLNIGDLVLDDAFTDPNLQLALKAQGLEVTEAIVADCDEALAFDTVLVDESDLVRSRTERAMV